jgi:cellobiose phosphorylase
MGFNKSPYAYCLNRDSFFGTGNDAYPDIFNYESLGNIGKDVAPIGALQLRESLEPSETKTVICLLGDSNYFANYFDIDYCDKEFEKTVKYYSNDVMKIKVNTPDESMNLLINGFLLYQSLV